MKILSQSTENFLKPINAEILGDAILRVEYNEDKDKFVVHIFEEKETHRIAPRSLKAYRFVENRFKHGYKAVSRQGCYYPIFEVPATDYSVFIFLQVWTGQRQQSTEAKVKILSIISRETHAELNALRSAMFRENKQLQFHPLLTTQNGNIKLATYQKVAAQNAIDAKEGYAFFCDPGTGKTAAAIAKIDHIAKKVSRENNRPARILIVVPKNIRYNWIRELEKFSQSKFSATIIKGTNIYERSAKIIAALSYSSIEETEATIAIINYDSATVTETLTAVEWDLTILDESHSIANPSTKRAKFAIKLRDCSKFRLLLTGTPIRNTPFDLYTQLEFLGKGLSGFDSFNSFKNFFGVWTNLSYKGIRVLEKFSNIPLLQERLSKHAFIIKKEEALPDLPEKVYSILECSLSHEQYKVYRQVAEYLAAEINSIEVKDAVTVNNILTKLLRLAQITSGYAVTDESGLYRFDPNPKLETLVEAIKEHLETNPDSKIQVWCAFVENIKQISYRLNEIEKIPAVTFYGATNDEDRLEAERRFNCEPECKVFIGNPVAGGVGLNLVGFDPNDPDKYDTNCDKVFYYSQNWSTVSRRQSEDRAHRKNTRVNISIVDMIVPGSIDEEIVRAVQDKIKVAMGIQDIQNILYKLLNSTVEVNGNGE